jgi:hypothetical protein
MEPASPSDRRGVGPQIYVHVEFGVSWNKKPPKNHEITFKSRNMREREPQFPRRVAAPNTNYLAAIHTFEERRSRTRQPHRVRTEPGESQHVRRNLGYHNEHQMQEYYHIDPPPYGDDQPAAPESRLARGESRPSHERGRSAPPPLGENPWDVNFSRRQQDAEAEPWITPADQWKALPAEPSQFRLGEGGMPWSAWSWPFEYHQDGPSHHDYYDEGMSSRSGPARDRGDFSASHAMASSYPPGSSALPRHDETGRVRDLGALSAAMMTVDNGFENQWWNQGERVVVPADDSVAPRLTTPEPQGRAWSPADVGMSAGSGPEERHSVAATSIVSPITANSESPLPHFQSLHRSLSTRSEELFFPER